MTLSRDARHLALPQVGAEGQQRIRDGRVLLIGVGNGVLVPIPGVIGTLMAVETLKFLVGNGSISPLLRLYDGAASEFRHLGITKRVDCAACA